MKVKYTGNADFQEFSAADFKKAEVEDQNKVRFAKGEPTEVSDAAGEALISDEGVFGQHSFEKVEDEAETQSNDAGNDEVNLVEDAPAEEGKAATTEGTADATTTTARSTGRGSSTRSR